MAPARPEAGAVANADCFTANIVAEEQKCVSAPWTCFQTCFVMHDAMEFYVIQPGSNAQMLHCLTMPMICRYIMQTYTRPNIVFVRAEGARMYDAHGKEYLDFAAGIAVNALGELPPVLQIQAGQNLVTLACAHGWLSCCRRRLRSNRKCSHVRLCSLCCQVAALSGSSNMLTKLQAIGTLGGWRQ